jgi:hypothetical protein
MFSGVSIWKSSFTRIRWSILAVSGLRAQQAELTKQCSTAQVSHFYTYIHTFKHIYIYILTVHTYVHTYSSCIITDIHNFSSLLLYISQFFIYLLHTYVHTYLLTVHAYKSLIIILILKLGKPSHSRSAIQGRAASGSPPAR